LRVSLFLVHSFCSDTFHRSLLHLWCVLDKSLLSSMRTPGWCIAPFFCSHDVRVFSFSFLLLELFSCISQHRPCIFILTFFAGTSATYRPQLVDDSTPASTKKYC
jgi:hypothetical protein